MIIKMWTTEIKKSWGECAVVYLDKPVYKLYYALFKKYELYERIIVK